jgi:hypothetical protein
MSIFEPLEPIRHYLGCAIAHYNAIYRQYNYLVINRFFIDFAYCKTGNDILL